MKLTLLNNFLSLRPFEVELPQFTLITGLNGSGKSQLLQAINVRQLHVAGADIQSIRLFGPNMFRIAASMPDNYRGYDQSINLADFLERTAILSAELRQTWLSWGVNNGLTYRKLAELTEVVHTRANKPQNLNNFINDNADELDSIQQLISKLQMAANNIGFARHDGGIPAPNILHMAQDHWNIPYFLLDSRQLREAFTLNHSLFDVSLGAIFTKYRDDDLRNKLNRISHEAGESDVPPLSAQDFLDEYGPPPWKLINALLADLNVDARFEPPPIGATQFYEPRMVGGSGDIFLPSQLSSGEEVILTLATLGYAATDRRQKWSAPSLVLLDEVDSPLHPAMAKTYLKVIREVLIEQFGMHVIATTHSPSTVAQSDLDEVYLMRKGEPGLARITRDQALSVLTEGVPTLSVSINDRRQVFAESPVEAENLDRLYQVLKPSINSQLSLQFIATGTKQANSGKSQVERIVGGLVAAGNTSVYGVIDWDTTNTSTDRIKVIAAGRRYALENIILDPVILATYFYKKLDKKALSYHGLNSELDVFSLKTLGAEQWQSLANAVTERVLGSNVGSRLECRYHGGMTINIDEGYLRHDAHKLEDKVVAAYPMLRAVQAGRSGNLTAHLIEHVLLDLPELIPIEVEEVFRDLLV